MKIHWRKLGSIFGIAWVIAATGCTEPIGTIVHVIEAEIRKQAQMQRARDALNFERYLESGDIDSLCHHALSSQPGAQALISELYRHGNEKYGIEKDPVFSYVWITLAGRSLPRFEERAKAMRATLTQEQVVKAQSVLAEWGALPDSCPLYQMQQKGGN